MGASTGVAVLAALPAGSELAIESVRAAGHVSGSALYIDDIPNVPGALESALVLSPHAHARIRSIDLSAALASPGVVAAISAKDIPGKNDIGPIRPDEPLLPNYKHVPIGYHGRASSLVVSGTPVKRPMGQVSAKPEGPPSFGPSARLDYELEVGAFIAGGNAMGHPIPLAEAEQHIAGLVLVNDWSARDVQSWEYQPLGPFLANTFQPFMIDLLGGVPVLGAAFAGPPSYLSLFNAALILAIMVLPFITAISVDVFKTVPPVLKEAAYGVGCTTWEVVRNVVIP